MIRTLTILLALFLLTSGTRAQLAENTGKKEIIFADNFSNDTIGKMPFDWDSNIAGEVVTLKKYPGKWLQMSSPGTYIPQYIHSLPSEFTLEFDFIFHSDEDDYNTTQVTIFQSGDSLPADALFPGDHGIHLNLEDYILSYMSYNQASEKSSGEYRTSILRDGEKARIAVSFQQDTAHVFVNGMELLTIPVPEQTKFDTIRFHLWGSRAKPLISNVQVWALKR